jgi:HK97 gp10 family phage protein
MAKARPIAFTSHVEGAEELIRWMRKVDLNLKRKVLRDAVRAAIAPVRRGAKTNAPARYGYLKQSLALKVKAYRTGNVVGLVGPRSDFVRPDPLGGTTRKGKPKTIRPAFYAHLVEGGTSHSRGNPFLENAANANRSMVESIMVAKVKSAVLGG